MPAPSRPGDLELWIGRMLDCQDPSQRESALLRAVQDCGCAPAVALWRPLSIAGVLRWNEVRSRGPAELLPSEAHVRAVLEAGIDGELGQHVHVIRAGPPAARLALALGGRHLSQDAVDRAEALLAVHATLDTESREDAAVAPALPQGRGAAHIPDPFPDPFMGARRVIASEAAVFASHSIELASQGFDAREPILRLDQEELAALVRELLAHARRACARSGEEPCRVRLELSPATGGVALALKVCTPLDQPPAAGVSNAIRSTIRRGLGTLACGPLSARSLTIQIWLPEAPPR